MMSHGTVYNICIAASSGGSSSDWRAKTSTTGASGARIDSYCIQLVQQILTGVTVPLAKVSKNLSLSMVNLTSPRFDLSDTVL